jgi:hypothetical protein
VVVAAQDGAVTEPAGAAGPSARPSAMYCGRGLAAGGEGGGEVEEGGYTGTGRSSPDPHETARDCVLAMHIIRAEKDCRGCCAVGAALIYWLLFTGMGNKALKKDRRFHVGDFSVVLFTVVVGEGRIGVSDFGGGGVDVGDTAY